MSICFKIEKLIEAKKASKTALAKQLGISREAIYNWADENIKANTVAKLSELFNVPVGYFFDNKPLSLVAELKGKYSKKGRNFFRLKEVEEVKILPDRGFIEVILKP